MSVSEQEGPQRQRILLKDQTESHLTYPGWVGRGTKWRADRVGLATRLGPGCSVFGPPFKFKREIQMGLSLVVQCHSHDSQDAQFCKAAEQPEAKPRGVLPRPT